MLSSAVWWLGLFLEAITLYRGISGNILRKYPFFYAYSASVLIAWIPGYFIYLAHSRIYGPWYWVGQFVTLALGYGILLEIFRNVLADYPGAEKFARSIGIVVFGLILAFTFLFPTIAPANVLPSAHSFFEAKGIGFERNLRCVQAVFVCVLLCVIAYYGIVLGRNMKGMILGYGIYIGTSLFSLAVRAYGGLRFDEAWKVIQPLSYDAALAVWLLALWSYCPNPVSRPTVTVDGDYDALVRMTRGKVGDVKSYLGKTTR